MFPLLIFAQLMVSYSARNIIFVWGLCIFIGYEPLSIFSTYNKVQMVFTKRSMDKVVQIIATKTWQVSNQPNLFQNDSAPAAKNKSKEND